MIPVSKGGYDIRRWAFSHSRDERVIDGKCMCPSIPCMGSILRSVWPIGEDNHLIYQSVVFHRRLRNHMQ